MILQLFLSTYHNDLSLPEQAILLLFPYIKPINQHRMGSSHLILRVLPPYK